MKNRKGFSIAIILIPIFIVCCIAVFIAYKVNTDKKIVNGIHDLSKISINDLKEEHPKGDFPDEMKDFLSTSTVNLVDYCFSHPKDFRNRARLCKHYEGVLLYKNVDLKKYKKNLLPNIRKIVGNYTKPDCFYSDFKTDNNLPYSPDLKQFQNTLIEWCLIANCFEENNDGNSAFLLSYAAARLSMRLLTDYADGASEENLRVVNNILRCACCQLIYIANSGLKHNRNIVRAIAKDLYTISDDYPSLSRTLNYEKSKYDNLFKKISDQGNYAVSSVVGNNNGEKKITNELSNFISPLFEFCDLPYSESGKKFVDWDKELREKAKDAINKLDTSNLSKIIAYAFINNNFPDYNNLKLVTDETRVIIDGAATVLATYEYISKFKGSFKYSPSLIANDVKSLIPANRLSGVPFEIRLPGSTFDGIISNDKDVIFCSDHETIVKMNKKYNQFKTERKDNNFGIVFLTENEYILECFKEEYKSNYFDEDEFLSKMTPEQKANYEKAKLESEKSQQESEKKVDALLEKIRSERVQLDSIDDFFCGYSLGKPIKNVKESFFKKSDLLGLSFSVESKKPFLNEFKLASVTVDDSKKIQSVIYGKSYDTTSERETAFYHIQTAIESMEGIKIIKSFEEDNEKAKVEYIREKDKSKISLSLLKGLDGGGTLSLLAIPQE